MTALIARHVDIAAVAALAAARVSDPPWSPAAVGVTDATERSVTVALAAGKAFTFGYAEHAELLAAAGADVAEFDPRIDPLPDGSCAVVLPGGFPEQFTAELVRQRGCPPADQHARRGRCARARGMRRADLSGDRTRRPSDVRRAGRLGALHRTLDAGLPRRRRSRRFAALPSRPAPGRARISPHRGHLHRRLPAGVGVLAVPTCSGARGRGAQWGACVLPAHPSGRGARTR